MESCEVGMIDLDRFEFEIECPNCRFSTKIRYRDVCLRDVLICRVCKANIQLDDHMNVSVRPPHFPLAAQIAYSCPRRTAWSPIHFNFF